MLREFIRKMLGIDICRAQVRVTPGSRQCINSYVIMLYIGSVHALSSPCNGNQVVSRYVPDLDLNIESLI